MNILMALSQLELTGAEVYAKQLADNFIKRGHKVTLTSDTLNCETKADYWKINLTKRSIFWRLKNIFSMVRLIQKKKIDVVHSHSRASSWIANFACKISNIPHISTIHGRQSTFKSRKIIKCMGSRTIAVCEEIKKQLVEVLEYESDKINVVRNPFLLNPVKPIRYKNQQTITLITRLSGPKGDLAYQIIERLVNEFASSEIKIKVVGGKTVPERFKSFNPLVEFTGFITNVNEHILSSDVVIASGRSAIDSLMLKVPTVAVGEAETIGLVNVNNIERALETNFGDMAEVEKKFDFEKIINDVKLALNKAGVDEGVAEIVKREYDYESICSEILSIYRSEYVRHKRDEIPVLMYHRVIKDNSDAGNNGIYVTAKQFEEHLRILKQKGYKSISPSEIIEKNIIQNGTRYVTITFDDGYKDNLENALPLLKKYGFEAIVFPVVGTDKNYWDQKSENRLFNLMNKEELKKIYEAGIHLGGHTVSHSDLLKLDDTQQLPEISLSKFILEKLTQNKIKYFAYPYGNYDNSIIDKVKMAGYKYAFATDSGPLAIHENPFAIRRIAIFPNTNNFGFKRKIKGDYVFRKLK